MKRTLRLLSLLLALAASGAVFAQSTLGIEVYKNQYCGCCHEWIAHLQKNGFKVTANDVPDTAPVRESLNMPKSTAMSSKAMCRPPISSAY
jgi:hypothetical protein